MVNIQMIGNGNFTPNLLAFINCQEGAVTVDFVQGVVITENHTYTIESIENS